MKQKHFFFTSHFTLSLCVIVLIFTNMELRKSSDKWFNKAIEYRTLVNFYEDYLDECGLFIEPNKPSNYKHD